MALLVLAALASLAGASGGGSARAASRAGVVPWTRYRAAAAGALPAAAGGPLTVPAASPLRASAVRLPSGALLPVAPALVVQGLRAAPGSPAGLLARHALAGVAAAPEAPPPAASLGPVEARYAAILRSPAFAAARPGPLWWLGRLAAAARRMGARALRGALRQIERLAAGLPTPLRRGVWIALGTGVLGATLWGVVALYRSGFERAERRRPAVRPHQPGPAPLEAAAAALAAGDSRAATRLAYQGALQTLAEREGIPVRPGWTSAQLRRTPAAVRAWPALPEFAAFHERLVFGAPAPAADRERLAAEAARWLEEVGRWTHAPRATGRGRSPGSSGGPPSRP